MSARAAARRAIRRVEKQGAYATLALAAELDASPLSARDRALATEIVYGVFRHRTRLDRALSAMTPRGIKKLAPKLRAVLRVAAYQLLFLDRVPAHAVINDAVSAARRAGGGRMAGFANGLLRRLAREGEPPLPDADADRAAYVEVACSLPAWMVACLRDRVGDDELIDAAEAFNRPPPLCLRVNTLRTSAEVLLERLRTEAPDAELEASPATPEAIVAHRLGAPEQLPAFAEGLCTVQDIGAQLVSRLANAAPGQRILDSCAGLGGKSTHLAQLASDQATVIAADVSRAKLDKAEEACRRLGIRSVRSVVADLTAVDSLDGTFDRIVLDAPCTGLGVLRRHSEAKWRITPQQVDEMAALQRTMLDVVAPRVAPDGALVYSVCSFSAAEGPDQVAAFCQRNPGWRVDEELTTWPHRQDTDAFYAARLMR